MGTATAVDFRVFAFAALVTAITGIGFGVIPALRMSKGANAAGRAMEALLAGVKPGDAATFLTAGALALLMAVSGSLLPAIRAE